MAYELNEKLEKLVPYEPIKGIYPVRLDANESYFNISLSAKMQIIKAISEICFNRYPDPTSYDVCKAFADFYGLDVRNVVAGNGSDELIGVIINSFTQKGDKILTMAPDFSMYKFYASLSEVEVVEYQKSDGLVINPDDVIKMANDNNVKLIIFSNPCNPTSIGLERADVRRIIKETNALVVVDEAYMDFYTEPLITEVNGYDNLIVLKTASKAIGMAAIRLGFAVSNEKLTYALMAAKSPYNVNSITQTIGKIIYSDRENLRKATEEIKNSTEKLYNDLSKLNSKCGYPLIIYKPDTNFVFIKTERAEEIYNALLAEGVVIRNMGNFIRITTGTAKENKILLTKLKTILKG